ncbi:PQQ-binding-like beta-propeller repeat protein [Actinoplanes solisilvae]|uniref:outer membrane protein assembly factor BamB family protein n=1 Tax=Actinoplanes solisilvae TaxID=2486853 RepID=UPI000FDB6FE4|nr:PQQ-binding-like beta-propeller repeat protein [Actinoplanes solisilvae]
MSRVLLRSLVALVLTAVAVLVGWRVLGPAEVRATAATPYPEDAARSFEVTGRTNVAPLIVDGRTRVFAGRRQIRADGPVDAKSVNTARWSLRRWPAQVSGVVAAGTTVVSRWSDGLLIATDARTGEEAWRVSSGLPSSGYDGHRTGASTVWAPPGLHVAGESVLVSGGGRLSAFLVSNGARRWTITLPAGCGDGFTTRGGQYFCATAGFAVSSGAHLESYGKGPFVPLACDVALSGCLGMRNAAGQDFWSGRPAPRLSVPAGAQLLGVSAGRTVVLTAGRHLRVLSASGAVLADFPLAVDRERLTWKPGLWQVTDRWVAIERRTADGPADPEAPEHYFTVDTVIIAAI